MSWKQRAILFFGVGSFFVSVVGVSVFLYAVYHLYRDGLHEKRVLIPVAADLQEMRERENFILSASEVVDEENGIYRISIQRAMELQLKEKGDTLE